MALTKLGDNLNVIQGLPDSPNAGLGGLTATQLKIKFDTAGNAIKDYLNNTLTTETDAQLALKSPIASPVFTGTPTVTQFQFDTAGGTTGVGKFAWNTTDGVVEYGLVGGNVTTKIGQDQTFRALNNTGSSLSKGQIVYVTGASGQRPTIALANANAEATSTATIGILAEGIANNAQGFVKIAGVIDSIDTSALTEGGAVWLSTSAGGFTSTKPTPPNHAVLIGFCIRAHATLGQILVKIQNGYELDELHDVLITSKTDNDLLTYESASGLWKNKSFSTLGLVEKSGSTMTGTLNLPTNGLVVGTTQLVASGGNVGIGTALPSRLVEVSSATNTYQRLTSTIDAICGLEFYTNGTQKGLITGDGNGVQVNAIQSAPIVLKTANTERMRIDSSGNVGIGTQTPSAKLEIIGGRLRVAAASEAYQLYLRYNDTTSGAWIGSPSSDALAFYNAIGTERMRINSSGNVGIGTTTPSVKLGVRNADSDTVSTMAMFEQFNAAGTDRAYLGIQADAANNLVKLLSDGTNSGGFSFISGTATERMQLDASGLLTLNSKTISIANTGSVTQLTSKSTGVTLNTFTGLITMNAAALAASTTVNFTLTNSNIASTDTIIAHRQSGGTAGSYQVNVDSVASGSCVISVRNISAGSLSESPVIRFTVIKSS